MPLLGLHKDLQNHTERLCLKKKRKRRKKRKKKEVKKEKGKKERKSQWPAWSSAYAGFVFAESTITDQKLN